MQLTEETRTDNRDWPDWLNAAWNKDANTPGAVYPFEPGDGSGPLRVYTLEGSMLVDFGDWIIKGVNGEIYPCKPDIFEKSYEQVTQ